jgi:uncharacterized protein DUF6916
MAAILTPILSERYRRAASDLAPTADFRFVRLADAGVGHMTERVLTIDLFSDKVGQVWTLDEPPAPPLELTLIEVQALRNYAKLKREPFSLLFTTRGDLVLPQRIYGLKHATLGAMSLFLVPVGREGDVTTYQALFN